MKPLPLFTILLVALLFSACAPAATPQPQPVGPATPTPEVFLPLDPSPTQSGSTLPLTCQVTDLGVYIDGEWGYCFAYPLAFDVDQSGAANGVVTLSGPVLEENADPIRVTLEIVSQSVPPKSDLSHLVDAYLLLFKDVTLPMPLTRQASRLGEEPAEQVEPIPGLLSSRVILAVHEDLLISLRFHPSDLELARQLLDDLAQTVTGSFAFFPHTEQPVQRNKIVSWFEFGREVSLSYEASLAPWVEARTVPAVPLTDQILFAAAHPAFAQIRFVGFQGGRLYQLPLVADEEPVAQVMIFPGADFPGYGDDSPQGFVNQLQALNDLLETGIPPELCVQPIQGDAVLPFLPWINMKQSLCAQPQILEFANGRGVRYLAYYSQSPEPVLDYQIVYTFQGLTDDGQVYISALFPVETGIFPTKAPACPKCGDPGYDLIAEWLNTVTDQLTRLNAQPADQFAPSLTVLDDLIRSIRVGGG
jgi:hypothetical protein